MSNPLQFRLATAADLPEIVRMLADDDLGKLRERHEQPLPECYLTAFDQIDNCPFFELIVAEDDGHIVGSLQLIFIPSISYQGGLRAQVESVRVDRPVRNQGIGKKMLEWAIDRARQRGAHLIQLTTHNSRKDAHRFYERQGFQNTHSGFKLTLN